MRHVLNNSFAQMIRDATERIVDKKNGLYDNRVMGIQNILPKPNSGSMYNT